ncbi:hypothetical protein EMIHUDRAFT_252663 [Emiliania huxleyi CCMP1516]|uniref:Uncharacterized protein n=2 Tax=Emiliania huxleyi TaxID=2903 RepID=A0A0D3KH99_EMIH1|nr:hypothetical protein EMIHUDRAFT_252663 [Emiliania huxleyi CCMP1516]EOD35134.1 hypothetical protein EMIHUDRAFT_252663 [Emiliania huxleyi CCMP1516]|eukprot:XP_005787563.1 hypothetical protein EMIHUDRAFT_252663 [Emiliania huxleyi CCMP1516]
MILNDGEVKGGIHVSLRARLLDRFSRPCTSVFLLVSRPSPSPTAVTIYPTSIVDGKLENCASKVAQIRLSRRAELVSPVRQPALLHSRACLTGSC